LRQAEISPVRTSLAGRTSRCRRTAALLDLTENPSGQARLRWCDGRVWTGWLHNGIDKGEEG
jgi:hypothetical protein